MKLRASDGLKIALPNDQQLQDNVEVNLPCTNDCGHNKYSIPLVICSEFPTQFEGHFVEYKVGGFVLLCKNNLGNLTKSEKLTVHKS